MLGEHLISPKSRFAFGCSTAASQSSQRDAVEVGRGPRDDRPHGRRLGAAKEKGRLLGKGARSKQWQDRQCESRDLLNPQVCGVTLLDWKPLPRNTLCGFTTVRIEAIGLTIADISVHTKNESRWVSLPSKPLVDRGGMVMRDEAGKIRYVPVLSWRTRQVAEWFSHAVIEALLGAHPGAFDEDAP
jgi:hypothetical protein